MTVVIGSSPMILAKPHQKAIDCDFVRKGFDVDMY